jgi:hypothetical protein
MLRSAPRSLGHIAVGEHVAQIQAGLALRVILSFCIRT